MYYDLAIPLLRNSAQCSICCTIPSFDPASELRPNCRNHGSVSVGIGIVFNYFRIFSSITIAVAAGMSRLRDSRRSTNQALLNFIQLIRTNP